MSHLLDFVLPADDHDGAPVLVLPAERAAQRGRPKARCPFDGRAAKRRKSAAMPERQEKLPANSTMLKTFSPKFRDWAARWAEGGACEYVVQCRDEAEVASYRQLLAFMHSMAKELPQDPGELLRLLLVAREHTVEAAVMGCVQRLQEQSSDMSASACMLLLSMLSTGASGEAAIQSAADQLVEACCDRLCTLLAAEDALQDAAEQQHMLRMLGPLHDMLNDKRLRKLWRALPLQLLRDVLLAEGSVQADTEATVLAACLYWAEGQKGLTDDQLSQLFCRIRFPDVPATTLLAYHHSFASLRRFDPDKELLLRAIADPALWANLRDAMAVADPPAGIAAWKAKSERWWQPRTPPLGRAVRACFDFQCRKPPSDEADVYSSYSYWNGLWWRVMLQNVNGTAGAFVMTATNLDRIPPAKDGNCDAQPGMQVSYKICLSRGAGEDVQVSSTPRFVPTTGWGWGTRTVKDFSAPGRPALSWATFWGDASPYCRDGVVRGRFTLSMPSSAAATWWQAACLH